MTIKIKPEEQNEPRDLPGLYIEEDGSVYLITELTGPKLAAGTRLRQGYSKDGGAIVIRTSQHWNFDSLTPFHGSITLES